MAENDLSRAEVPYTKVTAEEHAELVRQYEIMQAPTLVVRQNGGIHKFVNVSEIRCYIEGLA